ncbi:hypothetical protein FQN57_007337 [Myotisia sp. PD_48]|nr:hypothetical protein FQN57_007337 [Myotisia sp. PD_48]
MYGPGMSEEAREARKNRSLLRTEGTGWDCGSAVRFLAGGEARWLTGTVLSVDAGATAAIGTDLPKSASVNAPDSRTIKQTNTNQTYEPNERVIRPSIYPLIRAPDRKLNIPGIQRIFIDSKIPSIVMGIPRLTRRLLPYAETVWLGERADGDAKQLRSVVIDGPALVYHVYFCLRSRMENWLNPLSAQPSSNEVSIGVMKFLHLLQQAGVTITRIYFDGAIPVSKSETRLERLEKSRIRLESYCRTQPTGFKSQSLRKSQLNIETLVVASKAPLTPQFSELPENPFMVPAVIEDLKHRWNWSTIAKYTTETEELRASDPAFYPWKDITHVVIGEADIFCARSAREHNAAILTGDSDLLVYDIGPDGSVVFFDSLEVTHMGDNSIPLRVRATEIHPNNIARSLHIKSLQRFAYEVKLDSFSKMPNLLVRTRANDNQKVEENSPYAEFLKEYSVLPTYISEGMGKCERGLLGELDPRISELVSQFEYPELCHDESSTYMYLPILIENHNRRCAWIAGEHIRIAAYSALNSLVSKDKKKLTVLEHSRRGQRIFPTSLSLLDEEALCTVLETLLQKLQSSTTDDLTSPSRWLLFALLELYAGLDCAEIPSRGQVCRFVAQGYVGDKLTWDDVHLHARILSIFYSLRILQQLLRVSLPAMQGKPQKLGPELQGLLSGLPSLTILSEPIFGVGSAIQPKDKVAKFVDKLFGQLQQAGSSNGQDDTDAQGDEIGGQGRQLKRRRSKSANKLERSKQQRKGQGNMFELLGDT